VGGAGFYIATRSLISLTPPTVLLPASRAAAFEAFIASLRALDGSDLPHTAVPIEPGGEHKLSKLWTVGLDGVARSQCHRHVIRRAVIPARRVIQAVQAMNGGGGWTDYNPYKTVQHPVMRHARIVWPYLKVRPFPTVHPVPSQGYVVYSTKEKLKPEHLGKSGQGLTIVPFSAQVKLVHP